ncbi:MULTISPECIES: transposase [Rhodobacterales]|uniref:transposase n=1 Tax=Rhodobacterales TaxID=204455 RepID=UPI0034D6226C
MGNGNRPTPEFRREAVTLELTSGRTRREIAEDLGIGLSTLTRWVRQDRDAEEPAEDPADLRGRAEAAAQGERGAEAGPRHPKKAAAFFAKDASR